MIQLLDIFGFLSVVLRGSTLALQSMVAGGVVFALFVGRAEAGGAASRACRRLLLASALGLALVEAAAVAADVAILMGTAGLRLAEIAGASFFVAGASAAALALAIAGLAWSLPTPPDGAAAATFRRARPRLVAGLPLTLGILAASVASSHAAARIEGRALPLALTALHQAATACWIGGLPYLLLALTRAPDDDAARLVARRFSRLAQGSVAVLLGAGVGLAWIYVGSPAALLGTSYGAMVSAKAALLALLLGLGALNYSVVHSVEASGRAGLSRLRRFAEAEVGIGFTVILAAASLTSQPPAADLAAADLVPLSTIEARMAPSRPPRLLPPAARDLLPAAVARAAKDPGRRPGRVGSGPDRGSPGGPLASYTSYVPGQLADPPTPAEIALSEFNHNVSGLVVLIAGLLALAARAGWRWARNWPLAFLALGAFLFVLADTEYWPLGPVPFWRGFLVSEALQHRLAVLLIVAFALFERRVQTGGAARSASSLVFPFVCFLGGALLLTHSHSLNNPKDELLAELSHVPIALLGIAAGWSRWLELRLCGGAGGPRRALSWVWPICFVLVGAVLLIYRES
jgi:putative copper resistance protein D